VLKKISLIWLVLCVIVLTVSAQQADDEQADDITRVCMVLNIGRVDDGTFNQAAYEGMQAAASDFGLEDTIYLVSEDASDWGENIAQCIEDGYQVIITVGFQMQGVTTEAAEANPDIYFIGVDHNLHDGPPNYVGIQFREDEAGFLMGYLAGLVTESHIVGGIYGIDFNVLRRFRNGFEQGVAYAAQERGVEIEVLGEYHDSFDDPEAGATTAAQFMRRGADVIFGAAGPTGSGGILYAAGEGVWVIGVDQDEYYTTFQGGEVKGAEYLISSALKRVDVGVYDMLVLLLEGRFDEFPGGSNYVLSTENFGISFANPHEAAIPDEIYDKVAQVEEMLAYGEIQTGVDLETGDLIEDLQADDQTEDNTENTSDD